MKDVLLALRNVTFGYAGAPPVLCSVDLALHAGERLALTGRNGAGKSTLLQILIGLLHPTQGEVEAFGAPCRHDADFVPVRRRVALLFQDSEDQLFCPTVLEDVAFGPLNLGKSPEEARQLSLAALESLGMAGYAARVTHHLSVGEKKLVALASLLSMRPAVLLLDEPTAGLDEAAVERVVVLLNGLDAAMLIVSQDHAFLTRVTRRTLTLNAAGRLD